MDFVTLILILLLSLKEKTQSLPLNGATVEAGSSWLVNGIWLLKIVFTTWL